MNPSDIVEMLEAMLKDIDKFIPLYQKILRKFEPVLSEFAENLAKSDEKGRLKARKDFEEGEIFNNSLTSK